MWAQTCASSTTFHFQHKYVVSYCSTHRYCFWIQWLLHGSNPYRSCSSDNNTSLRLEGQASSNTDQRYTLEDSHTANWHKWCIVFNLTNLQISPINCADYGCLTYVSMCFVSKSFCWKLSIMDQAQPICCALLSWRSFICMSMHQCP